MRRNDRLRVGAVLLALLSAAWSFADEPQSYAGWRVGTVDARTPDEIAAVEATGAIILNCIPRPGAIDVAANDEQLAKIRDLGLPVSVSAADLDALIREERLQPAGRADAFDDFFLAYHRYGDAATPGTIVWYLHELVARYPALASMQTIGTTVENRPIWAMRIANDAVAGPKPGVCYYACQHAREWITTTVIPYHARHLLENYATDPHIRDMVDHVEIFLVPVSNPDGYEYTWTNNRLWRKNRKRVSASAYGVDLNRNWGYTWGYDNVGSSPFTSSETYRGSAAFSEPETQALRDLILAHPNIRAVLDLHSYSQLLLWPWGHLPALPQHSADYSEIGNAMCFEIFRVFGRQYAAGPIYSTIYPTNGDGADWAYGALGILSMSFELRPTTASPGFQLPPSEIIPQNVELLPAMLYLTNSPWVRAPVRIDLPDGAPSHLLPGVDTVISVTVRSNFETLAAGSATLHYRYDASGPYQSVPLTPLGGNAYQAVLPATHCASTPQFYFAAESIAGSVVYNPYPGPNAPHTATVGGSCQSPPGDFNGDGVVNLVDYAAFSACFTGPAGALKPGCFVFDLDPDENIDLADFAALQQLVAP